MTEETTPSTDSQETTAKNSLWTRATQAVTGIIQDVTGQKKVSFAEAVRSNFTKQFEKATAELGEAATEAVENGTVAERAGKALHRVTHGADGEERGAIQTARAQAGKVSAKAKGLVGRDDGENRLFDIDEAAPKAGSWVSRAAGKATDKVRETRDNIQGSVEEARASANQRELFGGKGRQVMDQVIDFKDQHLKGSVGQLKDAVMQGDIKQRALGAGAVVAGLHGAKDALKKDANGKRHILRGAVQMGAAVGAAAFMVKMQRAGAQVDTGRGGPGA